MPIDDSMSVRVRAHSIFVEIFPRLPLAIDKASGPCCARPEIEHDLLDQLPYVASPSQVMNDSDREGTMNSLLGCQVTFELIGDPYQFPDLRDDSILFGQWWNRYE